MITILLKNRVPDSKRVWNSLAKKFRRIAFLSNSMKVGLIFLSLFWAIASPAADAPYIISGFDDVLRQADNTGLIQAAKKILEPDRTFNGMPELYRALSQQRESPHFSMISAISTWFESRVEKLLSTARFPSHQLYLRNWITEPSIENFKMAKIAKIISQYPNENFIVIFDNSDPSLEMTEKLRQEYPNRILAIYLHQIVDKKLPLGATPYYTAFDIALAEFRAGRMTLNQLRLVAQSLLATHSIQNVFPEYANIPKSFENCDNLGNESKAMCLAVTQHIRNLCTQRTH